MTLGGAATKLSYASEHASGEVGELLSVVVDRAPETQRLFSPWRTWSLGSLSHGKVVFEVRGPANELVQLFQLNEKVSWMVETPGDANVSYLFDGYITQVEQTCVTSSYVQSRIQVVVAGSISCYYDGPVAVSKEDVFSRKASRNQADVLSEVLSQVVGGGM